MEVRHMKSCLDGYLTEACKTCEFWKNNNEEIGCSAPYPIMDCDAFGKMYNKEIERERE